MIASVTPSYDLKSFDFDSFEEPHRTFLFRIKPELTELWNLLGDDDQTKGLLITCLQGTHHLDVERVVLPYLQQMRWWKHPFVQEVHRNSSKPVRDWLLGQNLREYMWFFNSLDQPQRQFLRELLDWVSTSTCTPMGVMTPLERLKTVELSPVISRFYVWQKRYEEGDRWLDYLTGCPVQTIDLWGCPRLKEFRGVVAPDTNQQKSQGPPPERSSGGSQAAGETS